MIRPATRADLPALLAIRDAAGAERLSDPRKATEKLLGQLIVSAAVSVWQEDMQPVAGFVAVETGAGMIEALLVAPGRQGRGIGRALLAAACEVLRTAGHTTATIALQPGTAAERHYRRAGWLDPGTGGANELILQKSL